MNIMREIPSKHVSKYQDQRYKNFDLLIDSNKHNQNMQAQELGITKSNNIALPVRNKKIKVEWHSWQETGILLLPIIWVYLIF